MKLLVSEIFGPTLQGEGASLGRPCAFLRLAGCNLACDWCDTAYTWDWTRFDREEEVQHLTIPQVADQIVDHLPAGCPLLVVTGGEPLLQQPALIELLGVLQERIGGLEVEVETAGTLAPLPDFTEMVNRFNISPKLTNSGNPTARRLRPEALRALKHTGRATWKFVAGDPADLDEIGRLVEDLTLDPSHVYVMPLGTRPVELNYQLRRLAGPVIERGWRLTPRLHIDIWGSTRGH